MDKATITPPCYEVSHQKLFCLGDMDDYHQTNQCAKKGGFPKYGQMYTYSIYKVGNVYCCCDAGNQVPIVNYVAGNLANVLPARSLM